MPKSNDQFQLTVNFPSGRFSYLDYPAADGNSVWLAVNTKPSANYFTLHRLLLMSTDIMHQLLGVWPYLTHENVFFYDGDKSSRLQFGQVPVLAVGPRLNMGRLGKANMPMCLRARPRVAFIPIPCLTPLALGLVLGRIGVNAIDAYVANIFINYQGQIMLLNPKTGHIFAPGDWTDPKGTPIRPEQIVI